MEANKTGGGTKRVRGRELEKRQLRKKWPCHRKKKMGALQKRKKRSGPRKGTHHTARRKTLIFDKENGKNPKSSESGQPRGLELDNWEKKGDKKREIAGGSNRGNQ